MAHPRLSRIPPPYNHVDSQKITSTAVLVVAIAKSDLILSLVPDTYHIDAIRFAVREKTGIVATSISHTYAVETISEIHDKGRQVREEQECIHIPVLLSYIFTLPLHLSSPSSPIAAAASLPQTGP
ncbi:hypothetical protein BU17DRAFT_85816 [Hysterangium stoloniferum]|nr:hypothetical protein BU17DRAFT_85816 [Hysterangium stoloniferum]